MKSLETGRTNKYGVQLVDSRSNANKARVFVHVVDVTSHVLPATEKKDETGRKVSKWYSIVRRDPIIDEMESGETMLRSRRGRRQVRHAARRIRRDIRMKQPSAKIGYSYEDPSVQDIAPGTKVKIGDVSHSPRVTVSVGGEAAYGIWSARTATIKVRDEDGRVIASRRYESDRRKPRLEVKQEAWDYAAEYLDVSADGRSVRFRDRAEPKPVRAPSPHADLHPALRDAFESIEQSPVSRQLADKEHLEGFLAGLTVGSTKLFLEVPVSAKIEWLDDRGSKKHKEIPYRVFYTPRFDPFGKVFEQVVPYDHGLTQEIRGVTHEFIPNITSKGRIGETVDKMHPPTVEEIKMGLPDKERKALQIPDNATVSLVTGEPKKVTVVKLQSSPDAPGDKRIDTNVRVIVDTVALNPWQKRHVKVVVLHNNQSEDYLGLGVRTEEQDVRPYKKTWGFGTIPGNRGEIRAALFVERMLRGEAEKRLSAEPKPANQYQEADPHVQLSDGSVLTFTEYTIGIS